MPALVSEMKRSSAYWLFGRFDGEYKTVDDSIVLTSGRLSSAQSTFEIPLLSDQDEVIQASPIPTSIAFKGSKAAGEHTLLTDITLRHYTTHTKDSKQYISGLVWARAYAPKKSWLTRALLSLLGLLLLLALNLCRDNSLAPNKPSGDSAVDQPEPLSLVLATCDNPLEIDADLLFDFNKDTLKPEAYTMLSNMAPFLNTVNANQQSITVVGHTDSFGSERYNTELSQRRADRVASWLIEQKFINPRQIRAKGVGESRLLVDGLGNKIEQAPNRRVEIVLNCDFKGIPVILLGNERIFTISQPFEPFPEPLTIDQALKEPELFFDSCDQSLLLSSDLLFDFNRASLRANAVSELERISALLSTKDASLLQLKVMGHTDTIGSEQHNLRLSKRRALRVARWLTDNTSITGDQLLIKGLGETSPIVSSSASAEQQKRNRRVELGIVCSATPITQAEDK